MSLARQARQAARYRESGNDLRRAEGMLLYRRWLEADEALVLYGLCLDEALALLTEPIAADEILGESMVAADQQEHEQQDTYWRWRLQMAERIAAALDPG